MVLLVSLSIALSIFVKFTVSPVASVSQQKWLKKYPVENTLFTDHFLETNASSVLQCSRDCCNIGECLSLSFSPDDNKCYLLNYTLDSFSETISKTGAVNYNRIIEPDCSAWLKNGFTQSGIYKLDLGDMGPPFSVYCDMTTDGGGWTVFQRRLDGSENFYRTWTDYKNGFGEVAKEYWLGNDRLHRLVAAGLTELRVDMEKFDGETGHAKYSSFYVSDESDFYRLNVSGYTGNAGNGLDYTPNPGVNHNLQQFSTWDADHDVSATNNCAQKYKGAWWYKSCHHSCLNGRYLGGAHEYSSEGIMWGHWTGGRDSLKFAEMKIRRPFYF